MSGIRFRSGLSGYLDLDITCTQEKKGKRGERRILSFSSTRFAISAVLNFLRVHVAVPLCRDGTNDSFWSGVASPLGGRFRNIAIGVL